MLLTVVFGYVGAAALQPTMPCTQTLADYSDASPRYGLKNLSGNVGLRKPRSSFRCQANEVA
jgi:hypothetical protein